MAPRATVTRSAIRTATAQVVRGVVILINLYRALLSPLLTAAIGPACRFQPTCSAYAREAIARYGVIAGGRMTVHRLARCRPAGGWGHDPVPRLRPDSDHAKV